MDPVSCPPRGAHHGPPSDSVVKGQSLGSVHVQPWALCHTYWPGLREVELLASVHAEQLETELAPGPREKVAASGAGRGVGELVDISPHGYGAWLALLRKGQGAPCSGARCF